MWVERSEEFRVLKDDEVPEDEPLVVHDGGRKHAHLVVFVHGLGGSRYGTWGDFPRFVFDDFRDAGVAVASMGTSRPLAGSDAHRQSISNARPRSLPTRFAICRQPAGASSSWPTAWAGCSPRRPSSR